MEFQLLRVLKYVCGRDCCDSAQAAMTNKLDSDGSRFRHLQGMTAGGRFLFRCWTGFMKGYAASDFRETGDASGWLSDLLGGSFTGVFRKIIKQALT